MHGFAFNINTNLDLFKGIIPCGISDKEVTSLEKETGIKIGLTEVKEKLLRNFMDIFDYSEFNVRSLEYYTDFEAKVKN